MRNDVQICASYWKLVMLLQASINGPQRIVSLGSVDLSCAPLAQSAERFHGKEKVDGSIPSGGSVILCGRHVTCMRWPWLVV